MILEYNKSPISLREGKVFIDGVEVMDAVACEIKFTPEVWTGKQLGSQTDTSRWLGYAITGKITRRRSTTWMKDAVARYLKTHRTPEFTIQGVMSDPDSDYYEINGSDTVTAVGCVLTGDIILTKLDSNGQIVDDEITFNATDIV